MQRISRFLLVALAVGAAGCQQPVDTAAGAEATGTTAGGVPTFRVDPDWPSVPAEWALGSVSAVAVDADDRIWVLHRPLTVPPAQATMAAPPVLVFDADGTFVRGWGGPGGGYEWPGNEHGLHVDYQGNVWISGNQCAVSTQPGGEQVPTGLEADDQILKFTADGEFLLQIGQSNASGGNADTMNVHRAADMRVDAGTNELYVADGYGNHRVVVFDAETGAFRRMWGAFGAVPADDERCPYPVPDPAPGAPGPDQFSIVHALRVSNDGLVYVADRENRRVQVFTPGGEYRAQIVRTGGRLVSLAFSADEAQRFLYVWEEGSGTLAFERETLELVTVIPDEGDLGLGHLMETDSLGNLYRAGLAGGVHKMLFAGLTPLP